MTPPKIVPLPAAEWDDRARQLMAQLSSEAQQMNGEAQQMNGEAQQMNGELPMVVGHYHMVAFLLNSLNVEHEPGLRRFSHRTEATCSHH
jgi:hypothetical protein